MKIENQNFVKFVLPNVSHALEIKITAHNARETEVKEVDHLASPIVPAK